MSADQLFLEQAALLNFPVNEPIRIGGNYTPVLQDGNCIYISGQIPRVGDQIVVQGKVGSAVNFAQACFGAQICTMRALTLVQQLLGTLSTVQSIPRMTVYVHSSAEFTQQSEVADAASNLLNAVLADKAKHSRISVGVAQLPKGAAVEIDYIFRIAS